MEKKSSDLKIKWNHWVRRVLAGITLVLPMYVINIIYLVNKK